MAFRIPTLKTAAHERIVVAIASALSELGIKVVRADEREYHSDLFLNILTYMHGADFGIAVFERLEGDEFNPNVSLEVGYMLGIRKQVCLLKDSTLRSLHADLVGKLYRDFNPQDPETSIAPKLQAWLRDWKADIGIRLPE
jgi:nucleoside 2-deoxyribosyltransferase